MGSNRDWIEWGERDPLYGVATFGDDTHFGGRNAWTPQTLYDLGEIDWDIVHAKWRSYGVTPGTLVEIGCGVGRYSVNMARDFREVIGLDVSPGMIEIARDQGSRPNVRYEVTNGAKIPLTDASCDAAFSAFVFQHFDDTAYGSRYFEEVARVLKPGGTFMIHLPLHEFPVFSGRLRPLFRAQYALVKRLGTWRAERDRSRHKESDRPLKFRLISYELHTVREELSALGFAHLESVTFTLPSNPEENLTFLFATRR